MVVPAIFFLEMNKPLSYIAGQAGHFFAPMISILFQTFEDYAYFLEDRNNVELLIQRLESMSDAEDADRRKKREEKKKEKASKSMLDEALKMESTKIDKDSKNPPMK
jgi:hypothetical protein